MKNYHDFMASHERLNVKEGARQILVPEECFEGSKWLHVYDQNCYIEEVNDGEYLLTIGNRQESGDDISKLAHILYHDWYVYEAT